MHIAEVFGLQLTASFTFDVVGKIGGVDTVDFQTFMEVGLGPDTFRFDFKQVSQCIGQQSAYFLFDYLLSPLCLVAPDELG